MCCQSRKQRIRATIAAESYRLAHRIGNPLSSMQRIEAAEQELQPLLLAEHRQARQRYEDAHLNLVAVQLEK